MVDIKLFGTYSFFLERLDYDHRILSLDHNILVIDHGNVSDKTL